MADIVHKTTLQYRRSVNTPDYDPAIWFINPDLSAVVGVPHKYWTEVDGKIVEMSQAEKDVVDAPTSPSPELKEAMNKIAKAAILTDAEAATLKAALGLPI